MIIRYTPIFPNNTDKHSILLNITYEDRQLEI